MKKLALVLDVHAIEEDFFEDCTLYGIKCKEEAYKCAWIFNHYLGTNFKRNKTFFKDSEHHFDMYESLDSNRMLLHYLYINNKYGNYFIRELKGFHFLWMVKGDDATYIYMNGVVNTLKKNNLDIEIQILDLDKIIHKNALIF